MTDKDRQATITSFKGKLGEFTVSLGVNREDGTLCIAAQSSTSPQMFNIIIDQDYIDHQEDFFKSVFQQPQDILDYLYACFNELIIEDSFLKFAYKYGGIKKKVKTIAIQLTKQETTVIKTSRANEIATQLLERDSKLDALTDQYHTLAQTLDAFTQKTMANLEAVQQKLQRQQDKSKKLKEELHSLSEKAQAIQQIKVRLACEQERSRELKQEILLCAHKDEESIQLFTKRLESEEQQRQELKEQLLSNQIRTQQKVSFIENLLRQQVQKNSGLREEMQGLAARSQELIVIKQRLQKHEEKNSQDLSAYQEQTKARIKQLCNKMEALSSKIEAQVGSFSTQTKSSIISIEEKHQQSIRSTQSKIQQLLQGQQSLSDKLQDQQTKRISLSEEVKSFSEKTSASIKQMVETVKTQQARKDELQAKIYELSERTENINLIESRLKLEEERSKELTQVLQSVLGNTKPLVQVVERLKEKHEVHAQLLRKLDNIGNHPQNPHKSLYSLTSITGISAKIHRAGESGWFSFANKFDIFPGHKVKYSLKINKVTNNALMFGFCTGKSFGGKRNFEHPETAYYDCFNRCLHESGVIRPLNSAPNAGEVIDCIADLANNRLVWSKNGAKLVECAVPNQMKNKTLYFSILLLYKDDEVDLYI